LLVEPWETGSHLAWATGYRKASRHDVHIVGLPGELWRWRLRGGALPLAEKITAWIDTHGQPDLLLVSGLVDVAEMLGLARRNLSPDVAVVIYQHESQLVYPVANGNYDNGAALRNWMSWCAADLVLFNSYYHLRAVADALPEFVTNLPDATHVPMLDHVVGKFEVFPVGVDLSHVPESEPFPVSAMEAPVLPRVYPPEPPPLPESGAALADGGVVTGDGHSARNRTAVNGAVRNGVGKRHRNGIGHGSVSAGGMLLRRKKGEADRFVSSALSAARRSGPPVILWPHRWERDKDPAAFIAALDKVVAAGLEFRLVLAGQDPPSGAATAKAEREEAEKRFGSWILMSGELDRHEYLEALGRCDLVVSCARHEFFGVAIVEAVASGCVPVLPNALSYPELIRPPWHSAVLYKPGSFGTTLVDAVARIEELRSATAGLSQSMRRFDWSVMAAVYDNRLEAVAARLAGTSTGSRPAIPA
jgi:glycosyltransferase involved in cell wall biosynthesis